LSKKILLANSDNGRKKIYYHGDEEISQMIMIEPQKFEHNNKRWHNGGHSLQRCIKVEISGEIDDV
jgi:hypothetical protein